MHPDCFDLHVEGEFQSRMVLGKLKKRIQVVITSGMRDMIRQGMLFSSNCVYRNKIIMFAGHLLFYISCTV